MSRVRLIAVLGVVAVAFALSLPAPASAGRANVAALQVALRAFHLYRGPVDGIDGPGTRRAVRGFQRRKRLAVDGIAGPTTRRALGRRGAPLLGTRPLRTGRRGWDVSALQFLLARRGFSPGSIDGGFGPGTAAAVRRLQAARGLSVDGVAGSATIRALLRPAAVRRRLAGGGPSGPVLFLRPLHVQMGDGFGIRPGGRMHTGIDFPAPTGTPVGAAGRGFVAFAGWNSGGYGYLVEVRHRLGFATWYAHLSRVAVTEGQAVVGGSRIGYVGSTGHSTGPHLHFEVRHNGIPINPLPRLLSASAARVGRSARFGRRSHSHVECGGKPSRGGGSDPATARLAC
jgi:murein DD-endopeptidase MepM/ murein hydrolase activator NlpD